MIINEENLDLTLTHPTFRQRQPEHYTPPAITQHNIHLATRKTINDSEVYANSGPIS